LRLWQVVSLFFMLLSLVGFSLWWRARHQPAVLSNSIAPSTRDLRDNLKRACLSNDPHSARQALDAWVRQHRASLLEMAAADNTLKTALDALNSALYGEVSSPWQGAGLWQAIEQHSSNKQNKTMQDEQLEPLYPP